MLVPGHAGCRNNEGVDRLVGLATVSEGQPIDHAGVDIDIEGV